VEFVVEICNTETHTVNKKCCLSVKNNKLTTMRFSEVMSDKSGLQRKNNKVIYKNKRPFGLEKGQLEIQLHMISSNVLVSNRVI
jgi:hypothetical protein